MINKKSKDSIVFISSGVPSPSYLDVCLNASIINKNIICYYWDRGNNDLILDVNYVDFKLIKLTRNISNPIIRFLSLFELLIRIQLSLKVKKVIIESFDLSKFSERTYSSFRMLNDIRMSLCISKYFLFSPFIIFNIFFKIILI